MAVGGAPCVYIKNHVNLESCRRPAHDMLWFAVLTASDLLIGWRERMQSLHDQQSHIKHIYGNYVRLK